MISFGQILDGLQIVLTPFAVCEVRRGAGLVLEDARHVSIHYVLDGHGVVRVHGDADRAIARHAVVVLPPGARATIECGAKGRVRFPEPTCRSIPGGWDWIDVGEGQIGTVLACATFDATHQGVVGLFDYLRRPIVEDMADDPAFCDAMQLLLDELAWPKVGTPALASILMKQCLILLLRRYAREGHPQPPWLAALKKPELGTAIAAMAAAPGSDFTLAGLGAMCGMSRAAFSDHFSRAFGRSAMDYLRELRLQWAAALLATTDLPVKVIASRVGFESRSYFSRVFRAHIGTRPSAYRRMSADALAKERSSN